MNTTDPTRSDYAGPCPRCGDSVPNHLEPGAYPGALSRSDETTYVCSSCGLEEAMYQWSRAKSGLDQTLPPVNQPIIFEFGTHA